MIVVEISLIIMDINSIKLNLTIIIISLFQIQIIMN